MSTSASDDDLFNGLVALAESAFPKHCNTCGREYLSAEQFLRETHQIRVDKSGLKQSWDDDDKPIVEVYRNCVCGSTLMDMFSDRRDSSEGGLKRRNRFGELMQMLISRGVSNDIARNELLKVVHGQKSELINTLIPPRKKD